MRILHSNLEVPMAIKKGIKVIAENRKAFHDYFIDEKFEFDTVLRISR